MRIKLICLLIITSCNGKNTHSFDAATFEKKIDSTYASTLTNKDSAVVKEFYGGRFQEYVNLRAKYFIPNAKAATTCKKLQLYLLLDSSAIKFTYMQLGFTHPWYFLKFLRSSDLESEERDKIITGIRERALKKFHDPDIKNIPERELLDYVFSHEKGYNP